jgi:hypothetical protein
VDFELLIFCLNLKTSTHINQKPCNENECNTQRAILFNL